MVVEGGGGSTYAFHKLCGGELRTVPSFTHQKPVLIKSGAGGGGWGGGEKQGQNRYLTLNLP